MKLNSAFALPAVIALSLLRLPVPISASSPTSGADDKAQGDAIGRKNLDVEKTSGGALRKLKVDGGSPVTRNINDIVVADTLAASVAEKGVTLAGIRGPVRNLSIDDGEWIEEFSAYGTDKSEWFGGDVSLAKSGTRLAVSAYGDATNGRLSGKVTIYDKMDDGSWMLVKEFYGEQGDQYGRNLSFSDDGKRIVMTVTGDNAWAVWEESDDGSWNQIGYESYCCNIFRNVAMSGDGMRFVAGDSLGGSNDAGIAAIFEWDEGTSEWGEIGRVGGDIYGENFGTKVSMSHDGRRIIGGSPFVSSISPDNSPGLARVFEQQDDGEWIPMGVLKADPPTENQDNFGYCVAMSSSGNVLVVGAPYDKKATVFGDIGEGEWDLLHVLESSLYQFGYSCSFSDDDETIAIGSLGGVEIYNDALFKVGTITVDSPYTFGYSVSLSDGRGEVGIGGPQVGTGVASVYGYKPPTPCFDSPLQAKLETAYDDEIPFACKWLKMGQAGYSCSETGDLASHCPKACGTCEEYKCKDSEARFILQKKERTCDYIRSLGKKKRTKMCKKAAVKRTCRETCGLCD